MIPEPTNQIIVTILVLVMPITILILALTIFYLCRTFLKIIGILTSEKLAASSADTRLSAAILSHSQNALKAEQRVTPLKGTHKPPEKGRSNGGVVISQQSP